MGACTPCITPWSDVIIKKTEVLHVELPVRLEENSDHKSVLHAGHGHMEKLEKSLKKANKRDKKCFCHEESDSNSDSSWSLGSGSTRENKISCKKLKNNHELKNYTTPGPINPTNIFNRIINSNSKPNNKSTYLENLSFNNLEEKSIFSKASNMDTDSDSDISLKLDTSVHINQEQ